MNCFLTPGRVIAAGFAFLILVGTGLLLLPISHQPGQSLSFMDAPVHGDQRRLHYRAFFDPVQRRAFRFRTGGAAADPVGGMGITTLGVALSW